MADIAVVISGVDFVELCKQLVQFQVLDLGCALNWILAHGLFQ